MAAPPFDVGAAWASLLAPVLASDECAALAAFLDREEAAGPTILPPRRQWLRALGLTPPDAVRVVIVGQDPYHGEGQAHGLAFSVARGTPLPPSLRNILTELADDMGIATPTSGDLEPWARQGVLLINSVLTVELGKAGAHRGRGWERLTDAVIAAVAASSTPTVFMLWGKDAERKAPLIEAQGGQHLVLTAPHPSPLSAYRGWFGSGHFSRANAFLTQHGRVPIDWALPPG